MASTVRNVHSAGTNGTKILNNRIGLTAADTSLGNAGNGVRIADGATGNNVGGTNALARNFIVHNVNWGIKIIGADTHSNFVLGNNIGLNVAGSAARNLVGGITIQDAATNNTVGGTAAGAGNVISAHTTGNAVGVLIAGVNTAFNKVIGNFIGTNRAGTVAIANTTGVRVERNSGNATIGGTVAGSRNVIAASSMGIHLKGLGSVAVQGNLIGTDAAGHADISTGINGIHVEGSSSNIIGGSSAAARNVISGWSSSGILLSNDADGNTISGNYLGLDLEGDDVLANRDNIAITSSSSGNQIGGFTAADGNVIAGATRFGISISNDGSDANTIIRNFVGVEADGTTPAGNTSHGIFLFDAASGNQIGGTAAGSGNLIANNGGDGVLVGSDASFWRSLQHHRRYWQLHPGQPYLQQYRRRHRPGAQQRRQHQRRQRSRWGPQQPAELPHDQLLRARQRLDSDPGHTRQHSQPHVPLGVLRDPYARFLRQRRRGDLPGLRDGYD